MDRGRLGNGILETNDGCILRLPHSPASSFIPSRPQRLYRQSSLWQRVEHFRRPPLLVEEYSETSMVWHILLGVESIIDLNHQAVIPVSTQILDAMHRTINPALPPKSASIPSDDELLALMSKAIGRLVTYTSKGQR